MPRFGRRTAQLLAAVALLTLALGPRTARADAAQARIHFERGRTFFEVDEYRKAIEEFKAAHVERADPAFLYNIAECYRHLGEFRDALVYYRRFLSLAPAADRSRPSVEKRIAELQAMGDEPRPVAKEPEGARSQPAGTGLPGAVPPGGTADAEPVGALVGEPRSVAGPSADERTPLYKKGWFIAAVAGVLVAGAVGVWALSRGGQDIPATPLGNQTAFQ